MPLAELFLFRTKKAPNMAGRDDQFASYSSGIA